MLYFEMIYWRDVVIIDEIKPNANCKVTHCAFAISKVINFMFSKLINLIFWLNLMFGFIYKENIFLYIILIIVNFKICSDFYFVDLLTFVI